MRWPTPRSLGIGDELKWRDKLFTPFFTTNRLARDPARSVTQYDI